MKEKVVIILSGGMDSTTLVYDIFNQGYDVHALSFAYGQKHIKECQLAEKTCKKLNIPYTKMGIHFLAPSALTKNSWEIPEGHYEDDNMKATVVPNRNLTMLIYASTFAISINATKLFYGAHAGDHAIYPDCRPEFVEAVRKVLQLSDYHQISLEAPYLHINKGDIVKRGIELKVPYEDTWTCYKGEELACGKCGSCRERLEAFEKVDMEDPIEYAK